MGIKVNLLQDSGHTNMTGQLASAILLLIRHCQARARGSSKIGRTTPLSKLGHRQAAALASCIGAGEHPVAVYTSPLRRATETTAHICEKLGLNAIVDPRLAEFELGTMPLGLVQARPDLLLWRPEHRGTDGVSLSEFSTRIAAFCDEIVSKHLGERVAVISHAGTIEAALRWALGIPPNLPWMHEFECLANASITELEFWPRSRVEGGAPRYAAFRRVGDITHLGDLTTDI